VLFPAKRANAREGKGTHPGHICGAKKSFWRADAGLMDLLPSPQLRCRSPRMTLLVWGE
jgi:hypothetical protein